MNSRKFYFGDIQSMIKDTNTREQKISNNEAWDHIFQDLHILNHLTKNPYFDISADEIKKRDGKEARLMTKIDHREHLPKIMAENGLSILAIKNGLYRIAKTNPFIDIDPEPQYKPIEIDIPNEILSIDAFNIKSESEALDIAYLSRMLQQTFKEQISLTVRGRLRGELDFSLDNIPYQVDGVQIEVDGGYEGKDALHLVEAKIGYRNNISIRQLLYPTLFWKKQKIAEVKNIKSYIFYYQDNLFRFIPFDEKLLCAIHHEELVFKFNEKSAFKLKELSPPKQSLINPHAPFPQADDFERIHSMFISLSLNRGITKNEAMNDFDLVERQYDYYLNVLLWMNLYKMDNNHHIVITSKGEELLNLGFKKRLEEFAKIIFSDSICYQILQEKNYNSQDFAKNYNLQSTNTIQRRVQTIQSWIKYFNKIFD